MRLLAISDLHVRHKVNREALAGIEDHPEDWLILAGDLGEKPEHLEFVFDTLQPRFRQLIWVPGNHELWSSAKSPHRGVAHYEALVELCQGRGVLTPEDEYPLFEAEGESAYLCPLFLLYDYSFCPPGMNKKEALAWASEKGIVCSDEWFLDPRPYPSREAWCSARVASTEARLDQLPAEVPKVLINHFPLREDLVRLPRIQRFVLWCGTKKTEDWHRRWKTKVCVHGHLHMRATDWRDGVRFEEVAVGYPRHWVQSKGMDRYLREILPGPPAPRGGWVGPIWHR